jgi:hypothetical protein
MKQVMRGDTGSRHLTFELWISLASVGREPSEHLAEQVHATPVAACS